MTPAREATEAARRVPMWTGRALGAALALLAVTLPLGDPGPAWGQAEAVRLHAAGSLRGALTEVAQAFTTAHGVPVALEFGASGLAPRAALTGARADRALRLLSFILSPAGQEILARQGFTARTSPAS